MIDLQKLFFDRALLTPSVIASALGAAFVVYSIVLTVYRLYFHPLRNVPGSKLAAASYWYEAYWTIWKGCTYVYHYDKQHDIYGPIIRINPDEVHIKDPEHFDKIYYNGAKFTKDPWLHDAIGLPNAMVTTVDNALHKKRRDPLASFFSRMNVLKVEEVVRDKVKYLMKRIAEVGANCNPVDLHVVTRSYAFDVVNDFAFGFNFHLLSRPDLGAGFHYSGTMAMRLWMIKMHLGAWWVNLILDNLPAWAEKKLSPDSYGVREWVGVCQESVAKMKADIESGKLKEEPGKRSNIFFSLVTADKNSKFHTPFARLLDETFVITNAGGDTSGASLCQAIFGTLNNPKIYAKLFAELKERYPDPNMEQTWVDLEKLPYLTAVIKEGLRKSYGTLARLPRVCPEEGHTYGDYFIPQGYRVGMSGWCMHTDKKIFPNHEEFQPERWLGEEGKRREKYLVSFSKGSRICLGINVAHCLNYLILGALFRKWDMELFDVGPEDMFFEQAPFPGLHGPNQRHLRVKVKPRLD